MLQVCRPLAGAVVALCMGVGLLAPTHADASPGSPPSAAYASATSGSDALSVDRLYRAFFLRNPDAAGLAYWRDLVDRGRPLSAVALQFAQSSEFAVRYGALNDTEFVQLVYQNVMGREPDARGFAHWTGVLADGRLSRGGMMLAFSDSAEFKVRTGLIAGAPEVIVGDRFYGVTEFVVVDRSRRNVSLAAPTLPERRIHVRVGYPTDSNGRPRTDRAFPMQVVGAYRYADNVSCPAPPSPGIVYACVGFPLMDHTEGVNWGDIPNHPADVGVVLDALIGDPHLAGSIDTSRIVYTGHSMGGITGLYFALPLTHDARIRAVASSAGFAPFSIPQIRPPAAWHDAPAVLMLNALDDESVTYETARTTVEQAGPGRVTFVTIRSGGHNAMCEPARSYTQQWLDHYMYGTPLPSADELTDCAVAGIQPGGTTGLGVAAGWVR